MSADNGIYILKVTAEDDLKSGSYRVANIHAIENLVGAIGSREPSSALMSAFSSSPAVDTIDAALAAAEQLEAELNSQGLEVEYGILMLELEG